MKNYMACLAVVAALAAACTQQTPQQQAPGTETAAPPASGTTSAPGSAGTAASASTPASGTTRATPGSNSAQSSSAGAPAASAVAAPPRPSLKEVTIPAGTSITVTLDTTVASDTSKVEDPVRGKLAKPIVINGTTVAPSGSQVAGSVLSAAPSGKVKGRASVAFRFEKLTVRDESHTIQTARISREAAPTKGDDAKKVGIGAGAGALIGAIAGGGKGAAIGGAVGAGAGTGVVMATKGDEVTLAAGSSVSTTIQQPVTVLVPID